MLWGLCSVALLAGLSQQAPTTTSSKVVQSSNISIHSLDFLEGQVLLADSPESNDVISEDPLPNLPLPRSDHAMAVIGMDSLYVFGGIDDQKRALEDFWRYDLNDNVWVEGKAKEGGISPSPRFWHAMVASPEGSKLYMFGGYDMKNDLNDLWRFSTASEEWLRIVPNSNVPLPRDRHVLVMHGNDLVLFGGYIGTFANDLWRYSVATNQWAEISNFDPPPKRRSHGATVLDDRMFVFGGHNADYLFSDLWEFDFVQSIWTEVRSPARPSRRSRGQLVGAGAGNLILFGGFDGSEYKQDMWVYTDHDGWVMASPEFESPSERASFSMLFQKSAHSADRGRAFIFGGTDGTTRFNDVFKYEISSNQWRQLVPVSV